MELIEICHAGNRSGNARLRQQPGQGHSGWRCAVSFRHLVERAQDSKTALVQIFLHERPSRALGQIRFRTVLARKKSTGQRKVRNHADVFAEAKGRQFRKYRDRKSTRLNSSHDQISYAVFCLKKKKRRVLDLKIERLNSSHDQISYAVFCLKKNKGTGDNCTTRVPQQQVQSAYQKMSTMHTAE